MSECRYDIKKVQSERIGMPNWKEEQCELECKKIARLRAKGRCEFSGELTDNVHHVFFGPWEKNWRARLDPLFFVVLRPYNHLSTPDAPHVNNDLFLATLASVFRKTDPMRLKAIQNFIKNPDRDPGRPDFNKLLIGLRIMRKKLEKTAWMDADCEGRYCG